ncbi:hypothetical protein BOW43_11955 [Solemya velum gill symbiont]|nr:hypothetical protein BOW43_11955 [Solemya velum gill symbiont]
MVFIITKEFPKIYRSLDLQEEKRATINAALFKQVTYISCLVYLDNGSIFFPVFRDCAFYDDEVTFLLDIAGGAFALTDSL